MAYTIYYGTPVSVLASLQTLWLRGQARKHLEASALLLGQIMLDPQKSVQSLLPAVLEFVRQRGTAGIEGIFFSLMAAAERNATESFVQAQSLWHLAGRSVQNKKAKPLIRSGRFICYCEPTRTGGLLLSVLPDSALLSLLLGPSNGQGRSIGEFVRSIDPYKLPVKGQQLPAGAGAILEHIQAVSDACVGEFQAAGGLIGFGVGLVKGDPLKFSGFGMALGGTLGNLICGAGEDPVKQGGVEGGTAGGSSTGAESGDSGAGGADTGEEHGICKDDGTDSGDSAPSSGDGTSTPGNGSNSGDGAPSSGDGTSTSGDGTSGSGDPDDDSDSDAGDGDKPLPNPEDPVKNLPLELRNSVAFFSRMLADANAPVLSSERLGVGFALVGNIAGQGTVISPSSAVGKMFNFKSI